MKSLETKIKEAESKGDEDSAEELKQQRDDCYDAIAEIMRTMPGEMRFRTEVADEAGLRFSAAMSRNKTEFIEIRDKAISDIGTVMPNLNSMEFKVVPVNWHGWKTKKPIDEAIKWSKNAFKKPLYFTDSRGDLIQYAVSNKAIGKFLSESAIKKSGDLRVHLSMLTELPAIIQNGIEVEVHPDYLKGADEKRRVENGYNKDRLIHRFYSAVELGGELYRIKTTFIEDNTDNSKRPHSYEVENIEVITSESVITSGGAQAHESTEIRTLEASKLLKGVEKSYDSGKKILDESEKAGRNRFRTEVDANEAEDFKEKGDEAASIHFRTVTPNIGADSKAMAQAQYEARVRTSGFQVQEALQDSMLGLRAAYDAIEASAGRKRQVWEIRDDENAYTFENRMSSMNLEAQKSYDKEYVEPIKEYVARVIRIGAKKRSERDANYGKLLHYMMLKHGLERNDYMREKEKQKIIDEYAARDERLRQPQEKAFPILRKAPKILRKAPKILQIPVPILQKTLFQNLKAFPIQMFL